MGLGVPARRAGHGAAAGARSAAAAGVSAIPKRAGSTFVSAALSLVAVLAVIYGLKQIAEDGLAGRRRSPSSLGLAIGVAFVRRQRRLADPLIDLRLFRSPAFSASLAMNMLGFFVAFGSFLFIAQYLQLVLGLSPLEAGLWTVPSARRLHRRLDADPALRAPGPPGLS